MNAIIIEDNEAKAMLIKCLLDPFEMSMDNVYTIAEAVNFITTNQYNYIFLDHNLPDGKGTSYIDLIKQQQYNAQVISISDDLEIAQHYKKLGYDHVLRYPFYQSLKQILEK
jgi:CheY-like chemotaxis protein